MQVEEAYSIRLFSIDLRMWISSNALTLLVGVIFFHDTYCTLHCIPAQVINSHRFSGWGLARLGRAWYLLALSYIVVNGMAMTHRLGISARSKGEHVSTRNVLSSPKAGCGPPTSCSYHCVLGFHHKSWRICFTSPTVVRLVCI